MQSPDSTLAAPPAPVNFSEKDIARFWSKVDKNGPMIHGMESPCWLWTASKNKHGYGQIKADGRILNAHRVAWVIANGPIPHDGSHHGICVCHRCDRRDCTRVDHLFLGTNQDNVRDRDSKGRQVKGDKHYARICPECKPRGEANPAAKLTADIVIGIRDSYAAGDITQAALAIQFNVHQVTISEIITRKIWKHLQ